MENIDKVFDIVNVDEEKRGEYIRDILGNYNVIDKFPLILIVEGMDGAGKNVYKKFIEESLVNKGYNIINVKEPSDYLRKEILESVNKKRDPWIITALFLTDRKHQFEVLSKREFDDKTILLFDRSYISTLVYQSIQGISFDLLLSLHDFVPKASLVFIFICNPEDARKRILDRHKEEGKEIDEFEKIDFLRKLRDKYGNILDYVDNVYLIDSSGSEEDIPRIKEEVKMILEKKVLM